MDRVQKIASALREYFEKQGVSQMDIARRLGKSKAQINAYMCGRSPFGKKQAEEWGNEFNILPSWLLTGEGEMLKDDVSTEIHIQMGERVPLIPASAFAGGVKGFAAEAHMLERCEKVNSPVAGAEMAIPITGDSMEPDYPDGSLAYIRKINEAAFIPWGHTVILDTENGAFIKKIYPDNDNEVYVWAKSINPNYPPMHIPKTSIHNIFRVLGIARIFTTM